MAAAAVSVCIIISTVPFRSVPFHPTLINWQQMAYRVTANIIYHSLFSLSARRYLINELIYLQEDTQTILKIHRKKKPFSFKFNKKSVKGNKTVPMQIFPIGIEDKLISYSLE